MKFSAMQENGVVQINGKSFLYPNAPILLRPQDVPANKICNVGTEHKQQDTQCVQILEVIEGDILEIALVNEGMSEMVFYMFLPFGLDSNYKCDL